MIIDGKYTPNISCLCCGHRHPKSMSCLDAKRVAEANARINQTNAPFDLDLNGLIFACKKLVYIGRIYALDGPIFDQAFGELEAIVNQIPTLTQHEF